MDYLHRIKGVGYEQTGTRCRERDAERISRCSAEKNTDYIRGDFGRRSALCVFDPAYAVSDPVPVSGGHGAAVSGVRHITHGSCLDAV